MARNLKKLLWKPGTMLYPVPAVLVSCGEYAGVHNIITIGWTGVVCSDPAMCSVSIRPERFSYELIRKSGEFAINLTTAVMAKAVDWCGVKSGREFDKFREMKLSAVAGEIHQTTAHRRIPRKPRMPCKRNPRAGNAPYVHR